MVSNPITPELLSTVFLQKLYKFLEFDPHFNAITGLNGSGKSNVFDAICFVMGITSLSHVRVSNLQELIYKYGNSGIEKATVSITFDNSKKDKICPAGMQDFDEFTITRQIVKGGKSKYYLNGSNATNEKIKSIFQSVQLNVNNPHFLIMQGKVTQVVKMKPRELLSLLEETAGTSLYEGKKKVAQSTIEKKDKKLEEIDMLCGPIQEKIEKHKQEKEMLAKYKSNEDKLSKIRRILVAHEYYKLTQAISNALSEKERLLTRKSIIENELGKLNDSLAETIRQQELCSKGSENEEIRIKLGQHKQNSNNLQKELNIVTAEITAKQKEIKQEQFDLNTKQEEMEELIEQKTKKTHEKEELKKLITEHESIISNKEKYVESIEKQLDEIENCGNKRQSQESEQKALAPLLKRISQLKEENKNIQSDIESKKLKCQSLLKERQELDQIIKKARKSIVSNETVKQKLMSDIEKITHEIEKADEIIGEKDFQRVTIEQNELKLKLEKIRLVYNDMQTRLKFDIEYKDHESLQGIDKKKVYGRILSLFKPIDLKYTKALEYIASSRIWNIVVDNEQTAKYLFENQVFLQRETCIPNSKILFKSFPEDKIKQVESRGEGRVNYALNVIKFDDKASNSMQFVFGSIVFLLSNKKIIVYMRYTK